MVPNRKKRYYFFEKKPKGYPRKRSKKKRLFFREHRRIRRHPLGYVGMAHFFSKEKDLFQLHKAKRFFFQQTLGSNIYQN